MRNLSFENEFYLPKLVLIQRQKVTQKWLIEIGLVPLYSVIMHVVVYLSILQGLNLLKSPKHVRKVVPEVLLVILC